ncbi:MAG TPA: hypothetical protein DCG57_21285 [Candidatus Riflebacteria bacterium]|jgi:hypothetical protein|nr:hypothetical protein [Candidatus Riflebacteria bacterium]
MKYYCLSAIIIIAMMFAPAFAQSLEESVENMGAQDLPLVTQPDDDEGTVSEQPAAAQPTDDVSAMRQRIIDLAGSKVGLVVDQKGEDGYRVGWQHLKEFYSAAYRVNDMEKEKPGWLKILQTVRKKINDWCGIFGTWAWRTAGLNVHWNTSLIGCKYRGDTANMGPGDIAIMKKEFNDKNHHFIVKSIDGNDLVSIDGNQGVDSIKIQNRKVHHVAIYYSVADAMGVKPTPATATPATPGSGSATKPPVKPTTGAGSNPTQPAPPSTTTTPGAVQTPTVTDAPPPPDEATLKRIVNELLKQIRIALPFLW